MLASGTGPSFKSEGTHFYVWPCFCSFMMLLPYETYQIKAFYYDNDIHYLFS